MKCHKHPHSSDKTAEKCYSDTMRRRVNRINRLYPPIPMKYKQTKYNPPKEIKGKITTVYMFFGGETRGPR